MSKGLGYKNQISHFAYFNDTDVAAATINIRMKKIWNENLKNPSSDDFRQLEKTVIKELQEILPNEGGTNPIIRVLEFKLVMNKGSICMKLIIWFEIFFFLGYSVIVYRFIVKTLRQ